MKKDVKIVADGMIQEASFPAMFKAEMAEINNLEFTNEEKNEEDRSTTRGRHRS